MASIIEEMKVCGPTSNNAYLVSFITEERKVTGPTINISLHCILYHGINEGGGGVVF
jgi:hypothetical protein